MGTRATLWVGDPADLEDREWLGAILYDGYPGEPNGNGLTELADVETEDEYRAVVDEYDERGCLVRPGNGWPFPWDYDVFYSYTYTWMDGQVMVAKDTGPFVPYEDAVPGRENEERVDPRHVRVPAPEKWNPAQPDGFIHIPPKRRKRDA